jgi:hypothetical protein
VIPTSLPPNGPASGDLTGSYPGPLVANGAISTAKLADASVTTAKVADGSITVSKLAAGIVGGSTPTGPAGGDLSGTYPNPTIGANSITNSKISNGAVITPKLADGAVTTVKIADGSVTAAKLAAGVIPTSLPPNGTAGGDLTGTYPNPLINKLQGTAVSNTVPTTGQVLAFNGTKWAPATAGAGSFSLPFSYTGNSASNLVSITNQGTGSAVEGINSSTNANAFGVIGTISSTAPGVSSAGLRGISNSTGANGNGVWGSHAGSGSGVYGSSVNGNGVYGNGTNGFGVSANSSSGTGLFATSTSGNAAFFDIPNVGSFNDALFVTNEGAGNAVTAISTLNSGLLGIANDVGAAGIFGVNNSGGEAVLGRTISDIAGAVVGRNDGLYAGVHGVNDANSGVGILAQANDNGAVNGTALVAEIEGSGSGNPAVFKANNGNVARIDNTGKGFFNGGTQVGGADVAEFFDIEGNKNDYEPGDVLDISQNSDRKVEKSSKPYSTLVAGVYATRPGLMLTEKNAEQNNLKDMVPMGVIGVIPTKVCLEGGVIDRGDLIVTSSIPGVAMKADPDKVKAGQIIGKALQGYAGSGIGKINVLVSVK